MLLHIIYLVLFIFIIVMGILLAIDTIKDINIFGIDYKDMLLLLHIFIVIIVFSYGLCLVVGEYYKLVVV